MPIKPWIRSIVASVFVAVFMVVFKPYSLAEGIDYPNLVLVGYGVASFISAMIAFFLYPVIFPKFYNAENWTVLRHYTSQLIMLITVSVMNYYYSILFANFNVPGLLGFLLMFALTFGVAILLFASFNIITYNLHLNRNLKSGKQLNRLIGNKHTPKETQTSENQIIIKSETNNIEITTNSDDIVLLEAVGNYLNVHYYNGKTVTKEVVRNTLKNIELSTDNFENLFRCHRAYLINLDHVVNVKGNAQGYKLQLNHIEQEIPVSRNYTKPFKTKITNQ